MIYKVCYTEPGNPVYLFRSIEIPEGVTKEDLLTEIEKASLAAFGDSITVVRHFAGDYDPVAVGG